MKLVKTLAALAIIAFATLANAQPAAPATAASAPAAAEQCIPQSKLCKVEAPAAKPKPAPAVQKDSSGNAEAFKALAARLAATEAALKQDDTGACATGSWHLFERPDGSIQRLCKGVNDEVYRRSAPATYTAPAPNPAIVHDGFRPGASSDKLQATGLPRAPASGFYDAGGGCGVTLDEGRILLREMEPRAGATCSGDRATFVATFRSTCMNKSGRTLESDTACGRAIPWPPKS